MIRAAFAALLAFAAAPLAAQTPAPAPAAPSLAPDYRQDSAWLCLPGRADACGRPLPTADLDPAGYGPASESRPAADPPIDCFYVYPTVSRDPGMNSDLNPGVDENAAAAVQFGRFAGICRPFAPVYRQGTISSIGAYLAGQNVESVLGLAYGDVTAAWRDYLRHRNNGRPFVLIGHSQGTIHLTQLLAREIEGRPEAGRMISALLIGYNVEVPQGRDVGGSFQRTPLCTRAGQTGCVVTYVSFRAGSPPPEGALFGRAAAPGNTVGCVNPAALAGGDARLDSYWFAGPSVTSTPSAIAWSSAGPPPAAFLRTRGLVSARCVNEGAIGYLAVSVNADPADARTDRIPGDVAVGGVPLPGWGTHLVDMNIAQGDLIRLVQRQAEAFCRRGRR
ncbi:DUF3089 domain-containing protein [Sphingosinicella sp.]|uniref:DUF3089 domain-containing protein n=1 Tax=Sphingosinicella sp. TaxID=1917971 RepID=UPI0040376824